MAVKKKISFGSDIFDASIYEDDYTKAMLEAKRKAELARAEKKKRYAEFEEKFADARDELFKDLGRYFVSKFKLAYPTTLREALSDKDNIEALNKTGDMAVVFDDLKTRSEKIVDKLVSEELVHEIIDEIIKLAVADNKRGKDNASKSDSGNLASDCESEQGIREASLFDIDKADGKNIEQACAGSDKNGAAFESGANY